MRGALLLKMLQPDEMKASWLWGGFSGVFAKASGVNRPVCCNVWSYNGRYMAPRWSFISIKSPPRSRGESTVYVAASAEKPVSYTV